MNYPANVSFLPCLQDLILEPINVFCYSEVFSNKMRYPTVQCLLAVCGAGPVTSTAHGTITAQLQLTEQGVNAFPKSPTSTSPNWPDLLSRRKLHSKLHKQAFSSGSLISSETTTSEMVFLGSWMNTSQIDYKDTSSVFLNYPISVPQLVRLGGEHTENAFQGEDQRTTELADFLLLLQELFPCLPPVLPAVAPVPWASFPSSSPVCPNFGTSGLITETI